VLVARVPCPLDAGILTVAVGVRASCAGTARVSGARNPESAAAATQAGACKIVGVQTALTAPVTRIVTVFGYVVAFTDLVREVAGLAGIVASRVAAKTICTIKRNAVSVEETGEPEVTFRTFVPATIDVGFGTVLDAIRATDALVRD
jgi:hypothetical protein